MSARSAPTAVSTPARRPSASRPSASVAPWLWSRSKTSRGGVFSGTATAGGLRDVGETREAVDARAGRFVDDADRAAFAVDDHDSAVSALVDAG